ncbi:MAG: hypothetical protein K6F08_03745 [bacterium]|nr:hypothetical protein [bacterium]
MNALEYVTSALDFCVNKNNQLSQAQANVVATVLTKLIATDMNLNVNVDFDLNQTSTVPVCYYPQTRTVLFYYFNNSVQRNNVCAELVKAFNVPNISSKEGAKYEAYAWLLQSIGHELRHAIQDDYLNKKIKITINNDEDKFVFGQVVNEYRAVVHKFAEILYNKHHDDFLFEKEADFFGYRCFCDNANKFIESPYYMSTVRVFKLYGLNQGRQLKSQSYSSIIERVYVNSFKDRFDSAQTNAEKKAVLNEFTNEMTADLDRILKQPEVDELLSHYPELKNVFSNNGEVKDLTYFMRQYSRNMEILEHSTDKANARQVKQDFVKRLNRYLAGNDVARYTYSMFLAIKNNDVNALDLDGIRKFISKSHDNQICLGSSIDKFVDLMLRDYIYSINIDERQSFYHDYGLFVDAVFNQKGLRDEIDESLFEINKHLYKENVFGKELRK